MSQSVKLVLEMRRSYMFVGLWDGIHQVHPLSVDLDKRQNVSVPDGLVESPQPGRGVGALPPGEAFLGVLRCDVVLPHLPANQTDESLRHPTTAQTHLLMPSPTCRWLELVWSLPALTDLPPWSHWSWRFPHYSPTKRQQKPNINSGSVLAVAPKIRHVITLPDSSQLKTTDMLGKGSGSLIIPEKVCKHSECPFHSRLHTGEYNEVKRFQRNSFKRIRRQSCRMVKIWGFFALLFWLFPANILILFNRLKSWWNESPQTDKQNALTFCRDSEVDSPAAQRFPGHPGPDSGSWSSGPPFLCGSLSTQYRSAPRGSWTARRDL